MLLLYHLSYKGVLDESRRENSKRMASIRCYKIDARGGVSQSPQTTSVQQPAPQSTYQQQPQNFPPPVDANGNVKDDLPF